MSRRSRPDSTEGLEALPDGELAGLPVAPVEELQPGVDPAGAPPAGEQPPAGNEQPAAAPEPQAETPKRYIVAPGRGITVRRGTLGEGAPIRETDLSVEQVAALVSSGHLVAK